MQALQQLTNQQQNNPFLGMTRGFEPPANAFEGLGEQEQLLAMAMLALAPTPGGKGRAAQEFGRTLQRSGLGNNMLRNIPSQVQGFTQDFGNPRRLLSDTKPSFAVADAKRLLRGKRGR